MKECDILGGQNILVHSFRGSRPHTPGSPPLVTAAVRAADVTWLRDMGRDRREAQHVMLLDDLSIVRVWTPSVIHM